MSMHLSCCRYLALESVVGAATAEAYGDTLAQQQKPSTQTEVTAGSQAKLCSGRLARLSHAAEAAASPCTLNMLLPLLLQLLIARVGAVWIPASGILGPQPLHPNACRWQGCPAWWKSWSWSAAR